jgi:serine/threonine protein kinase
VLGGKSYGPEVDIWSMFVLINVTYSSGINMYAMLTGRLPFNSPNVTTLHALMLDQKFDMPSALSDGLDGLSCLIFRRTICAVSPSDCSTARSNYSQRALIKSMAWFIFWDLSAYSYFRPAGLFCVQMFISFRMSKFLNMLLGSGIQMQRLP